MHGQFISYKGTQCTHCEGNITRLIRKGVTCELLWKLTGPKMYRAQIKFCVSTASSHNVWRVQFALNFTLPLVSTLNVL